MPSDIPSVRSSWTVPLATAGILTLLALAVQGQDANWDLRNYHLYTPVALMDGRFWQDIAAGQLQTWHNPALDFPFAWMVHAGLPGWLVSLWLALPAFLALAFALRLMDQAWPEGRSGLRTGAAGLVAVTGASVLPTIGTTFNDAFVAAGMLAALWWVIDSRGQRGIWATWLPAGFLAGMAAGLKLTGALYCLAFIAVALAAGPWRGIPPRLLALGVGGTVGAALAAGPWAFLLWQEHGNPLFPYFNQWFQSPDALAQPHKDLRFVPQGLDTLLVPFHLLFESYRYSEIKLADPRILLGFAALFVAWFSTRRKTDPGPRILLVFALASFAVWTKLYGIYRYLFALELVSSIAIVAMLAHWLPVRTRRAGLVLAALALVGMTDRPHWGREPFGTPMVDVRFPPLPDDSLVVLGTTEPLGYAVAFLPRDVPAISLYNNFMAPDRCTRLQARVETRVRTHAGPIFLLREPPGAEAAGTPWQAYGLVQHAPCQPVSSNIGKLELCPLVREATPPTACAWPPADR